MLPLQRKWCCLIFPKFWNDLAGTEKGRKRGARGEQGSVELCLFWSACSQTARWDLKVRRVLGSKGRKDESWLGRTACSPDAEVKVVKCQMKFIPDGCKARKKKSWFHGGRVNYSHLGGRGYHNSLEMLQVEYSAVIRWVHVRSPGERSREESRKAPRLSGHRPQIPWLLRRKMDLGIRYNRKSKEEADEDDQG